MRHMSSTKMVLGAAAFAAVACIADQPPKDWPEWQEGIVQIKSTIDGTDQPCHFWAPDKASSEAVPLIVGLHTWSGDYTQLAHYRIVRDFAKKSGWAFVGPNFRGPNSTPEGCGSDLAV